MNPEARATGTATQHDQMTQDGKALKVVASDGAAISLGAQMGRFGAQIVFQVLLARALSPQDFGVVAMAAPVLVLLQMFVEFGFAQATIQRPNISAAELDFLFWINLALALVLSLVAFAVAPVAAAFYDEPRVAPVIAVLGVLFVLTPLSSQHIALLNRNMAFGRLAIIDILAYSLGAASGLVSAATGMAYWSIVIAQGVTLFLTVILAWALSPWRPGFPQGGTDWKPLTAFGGNLTLFNVANFFSRNADDVLIGYAHGSDALGMYDRAYKMMLAPLTQVSNPLARVALPLLARTLDAPALYKLAFARMLELVVTLTYPVVVFCVVAHEQLILALLGPKWQGVAPVFAILGLGAFFAPIGHGTAWLFTSQGRTRQMRNYGLLSSIVFVGAIVSGLPWGIIGVAAGYIGAGIFIQGPMVLLAATREGPVRLTDVLRTLEPHAIATAGAFGATLFLQKLLPGSILSLVTLFFVAHASYLGLMMTTRRGRATVREFWRYGSSLPARVLRTH